jgi:hypothetical protein
MKITIGKLKSLIRESILDEHSGGYIGKNRNIDLMYDYKYDPTTWTSSKLYHAIISLFGQVYVDLGIKTEDMSDPGFIDYCCDTLTDRKVPFNVIDQVEERLQNRRFGRDDFVPPLNF